MKIHQWINSRGKRLSAMIHRSEGLKEGVPVVIFCHGFTADKVGTNQLMLNIAKGIEAAGIVCVRFDFAGSGESEGEFAVETTVSGWQEDLRSVIRWVRNQAEFAASPIFLLGHSLGGTIVLNQGDEDGTIAGRIVLAPMLNLIDNFRATIIGPELWAKISAGETIMGFNGRGFYLNKEFASDLLEHDYQPLETAKLYAAPLLVIHGTGDAMVPISGSEELYQTYSGQKDFEVLEGVNHVFVGHHAELRARIVKWLGSIL